MAVITQIEKVQTQALDALAESQTKALEVNEKFADAVKDRLPELKVPFAGFLPTPAEGVKLYFDFAGKLLANNRAFAEKFVSAWSVPAPKPAAKSRVRAAA
jgi:hypothetical protein